MKARKVLAVLMAMVLAVGVFGVGAMTVYANEIIVEIDGARVVFPDQGPVLIDGRVLVPVRGVFEHLGYTPYWDEATLTATLADGVNTIVITIGQTTFTTNGVQYTLDVPAQTIGGRTMIPLRHVLESVGMTLDWDGDRNAVLITTPVVEIPDPVEPDPDEENGDENGDDNGDENGDEENGDVNGDENDVDENGDVNGDENGYDENGYDENGYVENGEEENGEEENGEEENGEEENGEEENDEEENDEEDEE